MAVTKMTAVTILGKLEDFENVAENYICNQSIHLENAMSAMSDTKRLSAFEINNQYDDIVKSAEELMLMANMPLNVPDTDVKMSFDEMKTEIDAIYSQVETEKSRRDKLVADKSKNEELISHLKSVKNVDCDISSLFSMKFINAYFGHMPKGAYKMLNTYLSDAEAVFVPTYTEDATDVWGIYFAPASKADDAKESLDSLYFERVYLPGDISGTPEEIIKELKARNYEIDSEIDELSHKTKKLMENSKERLEIIYSIAAKRKQLSLVYEKAAHSKEMFYIVGWMPEKDAEKMKKRADEDAKISMFYMEKAENLKNIISPPTKLKNNIFFKPFEFFVKMYGMPGYNEFDPTPLLALTYILFFGMMFGDVGQSAIFAIGGFLIYRFKKIDLANIIGVCGLSGIVFGFIYGSVFGKENIIKGIIPPMEHITELLIATIAIGAIIIIFGMILNITNCFRQSNRGEMLFSSNGIAGLVFYVSVILLALGMFIPQIKIPGGILVVLIAISLLAIFMKEPLCELLNGSKKAFAKGGMFYVQSFFELFEVLLSYFSNTISFLRVGAFAIVHVGMMMAVEMLSAGGGVKTIVVSVLGNILVMVLEGLVVGIQVLRLEYYEMFSRYFTGNGKPFNSLKINK